MYMYCTVQCSKSLQNWTGGRGSCILGESRRPYKTVSAALAALAPHLQPQYQQIKKELYESLSATDFMNKGDEFREPAAAQLNSADA